MGFITIVSRLHPPWNATSAILRGHRGARQDEGVLNPAPTASAWQLASPSPGVTARASASLSPQAGWRETAS